ncbi:hypothetical protein ACFFNY_14780 [Paenibacillus hodogayensis]|uniref:Uncharacterized protein n=1 Tax=Paenibacillus hodogayensis TaxID=279208 RepID=A0ABV5VXM3_9BACL
MRHDFEQAIVVLFSRDLVQEHPGDHRQFDDGLYIFFSGLRFDF